MVVAYAFSSYRVQAQFPYVVDGKVYEGDTSHPIEGAEVSVTMYHSDETNDTLNTTTAEDGQYSVAFDYGDYEVGDTIEVVATYDGRQQTETDIVKGDDPGGKTIDVIIPYLIPQLKGTIGVTLGMFVVAVIALVALRKYPYV